MVCQSNMAALSEGAALFIRGYDSNSAVAPSGFDRLVSGYRLPLIRPRQWGVKGRSKPSPYPAGEISLLRGAIVNRTKYC